MILLGREGVGKTSLVEQFIYKQFNEEYRSTIGIKLERSIWTEDEDSISLVCWDLGGESARAHTPDALYERAQGVMIVFDLTDPGSYADLGGIFSFLDKKLPGVPRVVVANKSDLAESEKLDGILSDAGVSQEEVMICSAKSALNVEFAFRRLSKMMRGKGKTV